MLEVRPITKQRTLPQWYEEQDKINMDPTYQRRGDLWPERNKQLLVNSILNQYDIPKIYLADFTYGTIVLRENSKPYAVIDGKQRLSIFFAFFRDKLELDKTPIQTDRGELSLTGLRYSDLHKRYPSLAGRFDDFTPTVMSVISDKLEEVQELFIRLNLNVSISGPERRNAMPGPIPHLIRDLSVHEVFRAYATFPINRGQDLNAAAKVLLMESRGEFANTKKGDLDNFVTSIKARDTPEFQDVYGRATVGLDKMARVFKEEDPLLRGPSQFPVYYWFTRTYADRYAEVIRDFLVKFEADRSRARKLANTRVTEDVETPDITLLNYTTWVRSPDDRKSQKRMFDTLDERFKAFLRSTRRH